MGPRTHCFPFASLHENVYSAKPRFIHQSGFIPQSPITLTLGNEQVIIAAQHVGEGEARETVPTEYAGEETLIGFNAEYLKDFLNIAGSENVSFAFKDGNTQAEFRPIVSEQAASAIYIVMPLRT